MKNYIQTIFLAAHAVLFLMVGICRADNGLTPSEQANEQPVCTDVVQTVTLEERIRIASCKYDIAGSLIKAAPCAYALQGDQFIFFGAPQEGYRKAALAKLSLTGEFTGVAYKKVRMHDAADQLSPLYNQKVKMLAAGSSNTLYVVLQNAPDTIYRYVAYDQPDAATVTAYKLTDPQGNACTIEHLVCGVAQNVDYVFAHIIASNAPNKHAFACVKSYSKTIEPKKKQEQKEEQKEAQDEEEEEEKKKIKPKPRIKHMFIGLDLRTGKEGASCSAALEELVDTSIETVSWSAIADMQMIDGKLFLEVLQDTGRYALYTGKITRDVCKITSLRSDIAYYRAQNTRDILWQTKAHTFFYTLKNSKYCLIVGKEKELRGSDRNLLAVPVGDKNNTSVVTSVGGNVALPGPITAVAAREETVFAAVATSFTEEMPGIFSSQAIIDGSGSLVAWSAWQRVPGAIEPTFFLNITTGYIRFLSMLQDADHIHLHTLLWRGPALAREDAKIELKTYEERIKREARLKEINEQKEKEKKEKEKKALERGEKIVETVVEKKAEEKPEFNCIENSGFVFGYGLENKYRSSCWHLCNVWTEMFNDIGGIKAMLDIPALKAGGSSYLIASGYKQLVIAQTNPAHMVPKCPKVRTYEQMITMLDGALQVCQNGTELVRIQGGVFDELGYVDKIHMASNGYDQWLCVAGSNGVAVLRKPDGSGLGKQGLGESFNACTADLAFKMLGSYRWVRKLESDDQFLYIITEDCIDRIPLQAAYFKDSTQLKATTIATVESVGAVCDGYVITDACVSQGMLFVATPRGLVVTAAGIDCRKIGEVQEVQWQQITLPTNSDFIVLLRPVSQTAKQSDFACKGQLYVVASSLFDDSSSVTRLFIDKDNQEARITVVPDVKKKFSKSWLNYDYPINAFFTDGSMHLVARERFEDRAAELVRVAASGTRRNESYTLSLKFDPKTRCISSIIRCSGTGTIFVAADDGVRIYE